MPPVRRSRRRFKVYCPACGKIDLSYDAPKRVILKDNPPVLITCNRCGFMWHMLPHDMVDNDPPKELLVYEFDYTKAPKEEDGGYAFTEKRPGKHRR